MNLPTAHNYVLQNLIDNLVSLEANFLKPNILIQLLKKTELALAEVIETFGKKEFSQDMLEKEKKNIELIIEKLSLLEKTSQEKLNWAQQFSEYLQTSINTK